MIDNIDAIVWKKNGDSAFPFTRATNGILMIWHLVLMVATITIWPTSFFLWCSGIGVFFLCFFLFIGIQTKFKFYIIFRLRLKCDVPTASANANEIHEHFDLEYCRIDRKRLVVSTLELLKMPFTVMKAKCAHRGIYNCLAPPLAAKTRPTFGLWKTMLEQCIFIIYIYFQIGPWPMLMRPKPESRCLNPFVWRSFRMRILSTFSKLFTFERSTLLDQFSVDRLVLSSREK